MAASKLNQMGGLIKKARQQKGLTQAEVAKKIGTNTNYYAKVERAEAIPSIKKIEKIVEALGTHSSKILPF